MTTLAHPPAAAPAPPSAGAPAHRPRSVLIVGGGIAGIAAALRLSEAGLPTTLLETRKKLGGRATSFTDPRSGETLDNCQHVAMGCCTAYLDLLSRLGVLDQLEWTRDQYWIETGGRTSVVRPSPLPAPAHFAPAILAARFLSLAEKAALAWGGHCIARARRADWTTRTFGQFLTSARQPRRLIDRFWAPVVISACNLPCDAVCAASALQVFQEGFFGSPRAAEIGVSRVPLLSLYDRAEQVISAAGGRLRLGCGVERLDASSVLTTAGERLSADAVICALTPERAAEVIDAALFAADPRLPGLARFTFSPILGVHLTFDRPVLSSPHAVLVDGATQWLFRKDADGRKLHAVISAADDWMDLSEAAIGERVLADIRAHLPAARAAQLLSVRSVKEKRATFAATPEVERLRPAAIGPAGLRGVILAGDYTATGWPATMEGAARSGYAAAAAILGVPSLLPPELPRTGLAPWLIRS